MNWLTHKFAQATQTGLFVVATIIGSGVAGGMGAYDLMNEDVDNITGVNRDKIVQMFEQKIDKIQDVKTSYDDILAERDIAIVSNDKSQAKELLIQAQAKKVAIDFLADDFKTELPLMTTISEQDYESLGDQFNTLFPFESHEVNTAAAAYLHDAQADVGMTGVDLGATSERIQNEMQEMEYIEAAGDARSKLTMMAVSVSMVIALFPALNIGSIRFLSNLAEQPAPQSPLSKMSESIKKNRKRKTQNKRKIN